MSIQSKLPSLLSQQILTSLAQVRHLHQLPAVVLGDNFHPCSILLLPQVKCLPSQTLVEVLIFRLLRKLLLMGLEMGVLFCLVQISRLMAEFLGYGTTTQIGKRLSRNAE